MKTKMDELKKKYGDFTVWKKIKNYWFFKLKLRDEK